MNSRAHLVLLLAITLLPTAQADELGRLFFTPTERKQLELQHALKPGNNSGDQSVITVNGVIKRSDGSRIVWINGKAQQLTAGNRSDKISVTVPGRKKPLEVKVGERIFLDTPLRPNGEAPAPSDNE